VLAQQLLFRHSSAGDLTPLIHAFFDTSAGSTIEPGSQQIPALASRRSAASTTSEGIDTLGGDENPAFVNPATTT
jgi:hypothetical protein